MKKTIFLSLLVFGYTQLLGQSQYQFSVDLNKVQDDKITVELLVPKQKGKEATYYLPKIVPGTYAIANYGSYASNFQAFDAKGAKLKVEHPDANTWKITGADKLQKISYQIDDSWDTPSVKEDIFEPAGTDIEENKIFVMNSFGFFGYFKGMENIPYDVKIMKPVGFYGSTSLIAKSSDEKQDVFHTSNYHELADAPMMYCKPDTAILNISGAEILISVYSPNKKASSKTVAKDIKPILEAQKSYLGGTLPIKKYAFIIYLSDNKNLTRYGALEHSYSSFYYLPEFFGADQLSSTVKDVAAHEFFHILTPLNIHSEEIGNFDYINPKMSMHLWMYEGLTEYAAHHAQLKGGIIDLDTYLERQSEKINLSTKEYDDALAFTELSLGALDKYKEQYQNVYYKGALIGLCLDIKLRQLSGGKYGTQNMMQDLSKFYGKDKSFKDGELFAKITEITYPEIGEFFKKHVSGSEKIPYQDYFGLIGVKFEPKGEKSKLELGLGVAFNLVPNTKNIIVENTANATNLSKRLGLQKGDVLLKFNGEDFNVETYSGIFQNYIGSSKKGDKLALLVKRTVEGAEKEVELSTELKEEMQEVFNVLSVMENASEEQIKLRNAWMGK